MNTRDILPLCFLLAASSATASELVYTPVNPAFGGNPLNGSYLLSNAQAQNDYKDPDAPSYDSYEQSALERFTSALESRLLSDLLTNVANGETGSMVTSAYIISVADNGGTITITITDRTTNETTTIEVTGLTTTP